MWILIWKVWGRAWASAFPTSAQAMLDICGTSWIARGEVTLPEITQFVSGGKIKRHGEQTDVTKLFEVAETNKGGVLSSGRSPLHIQWPYFQTRGALWGNHLFLFKTKKVKSKTECTGVNILGVCIRLPHTTPEPTHTSGKQRARSKPRTVTGALLL